MAIPPEQVEIIGVLLPVDSVTGFQVTPVVGIIPPNLRYHASRDEVAAVFEMPLAEALRLGRYHPGYPSPRELASGLAFLASALFCLGNDRGDYPRAGLANRRQALTP